jgi:hypothetical protein
VPVDTIACAGALHPAVAEAAYRAGAEAVGLVDLGGPGGVALRLDAIGIAYSDGRRRGDPAAPAQVEVRLVGGRPVPGRPLPRVASRETVAPGTLEALADALDRVAAGVLPVVTTTWSLSGLTLEGRARFLQRLDAAATHRTVAWVSVEGVGVAPGVPTLGDRPASGHSIVGLALLAHRILRVEAVGRCWSRGRHLAWLADEGPDEQGR